MVAVLPAPEHEDFCNRVNEEIVGSLQVRKTDGLNLLYAGLQRITRRVRRQPSEESEDDQKLAEDAIVLRAYQIILCCVSLRDDGTIPNGHYNPDHPGCLCHWAAQIVRREVIHHWRRQLGREAALKQCDLKRRALVDLLQATPYAAQFQQLRRGGERAAPYRSWYAAYADRGENHPSPLPYLLRDILADPGLGEPVKDAARLFRDTVTRYQQIRAPLPLADDPDLEIQANAEAVAVRDEIIAALGPMVELLPQDGQRLYTLYTDAVPESDEAAIAAEELARYLQRPNMRARLLEGGGHER